MRRIGERRAAGVVIGQDRRHDVGQGRPHAVEMREVSVAVPEKTHHRHHPVDGVVELRRRRDVARREGMAQRQEIEQQFDQRTRVAADVPAVGQDLVVDLGDELLDGAAHVPGLAGHAERRIGQRHQRLHPRHALARLERGVTQIAHLAHQAAQKAPVERVVGIVQDQRRLAEPRRDASRQNFRLPAYRVPRALHGNPLVHQRPRIGAGDTGLGRAQMAQPAEAEQGRRPFVGRRHDLERRAAVADHHFAGEGEAPGVDLARARAVGGAQVLRRDQQPLGLARDEAHTNERVAAQASGGHPQGAASQKQQQLGPLPDRQAGHKYARLYCRLRALRPVPCSRRNIAKAGSRANRHRQLLSAFYA